MKYLLLILTFSTCNCLLSQAYQTFNLTPDIGAYKQSSEFITMIIDSQTIYIFGAEKFEITAGVVAIKNHYSKFDYLGNLISTTFFEDTALNKIYLLTAFSPVKVNDSIYYVFLGTENDVSRRYLDPTLIKFNIRTKTILQKKIIRHPLGLDQGFAPRAISYDSVAKSCVIGFQTYIGEYPFAYIYELDSAFNILKMFSLPKLPLQTTPDWIEKKSDGIYELICDAYEIKNGELTGLIKFTYIMVDSAGNILKKKDLNVSQPIGMVSGETYTIYRNADKTFNISAHEFNVKLEKAVPWAFHVSPEFDTIYWLKRFYDYPEIKIENPQYLLNDMAYSPFDTSFVTSGDINEQGTQNTYGLLFKVTKDGDSLWTRKYLPAGFGPDRALWMNFYQVAISPYNTIIVCGRVSDVLEQVVKGWLLQLDKDGCLVPGCGEIVKNEDIASGIVSAFKIYPNPIHDKFYLLSRISSNDNYQISIFNLQGQKIKETRVKPELGLQYIFMIPDDLISGNYILSISDEKGKLVQEEKLIIQK